ncbi:MAG TPA: hypothetical protein VGZ73_07660 [Bryobacteraceae bacterium]|jgi:hypothetical protein|nr:hypothetical protein [Bryobacteraceae bacterium]
MRSTLLIAFLPAVLCAAPALQIVKPIISQMDGGTPDPPGFEHVPGETLYFSCRINGYVKTPDEKIHLTYSVQAFDPKGVALTELYKNEIVDEVSPQDKGWMPKIETEVGIPPLVASGAYKIVVKVEDAIAKASQELAVPFQVRGHEVAPSETLLIRNFRFFRNEDDPQALAKASYKPGDGVWAKFDITGYKYGEANKIDVSYVTSVIAPSGKVLWTQPEPATEQSESFYPKRYVAASFGITLQPNIRPGEYTIAVQVKDAVGSQTHEAKGTFTIE